MLDLFHTRQDLQAWGVSLVAQTGSQFDPRTEQGKLIVSLMAALAEFERDLLRDRFLLCMVASFLCMAQTPDTPNDKHNALRWTSSGSWLERGQGRHVYGEAFNDGRWLESDVLLDDPGRGLHWGFTLGQIKTNSTLRIN